MNQDFVGDCYTVKKFQDTVGSLEIPQVGTLTPDVSILPARYICQAGPRRGGPSLAAKVDPVVAKRIDMGDVEVKMVIIGLLAVFSRLPVNVFTLQSTPAFSL